MIDLDNVDDSDSVVRILVREVRAARALIKAAVAYNYRSVQWGVSKGDLSSDGVRRLRENFIVAQKAYKDAVKS